LLRFDPSKPAFNRRLTAPKPFSGFWDRPYPLLGRRHMDNAQPAAETEAAIRRMQKAAQAGRGVRLTASEVWALAGIGPLCQVFT